MKSFLSLLAKLNARISCPANRSRQSQQKSIRNLALTRISTKNLLLGSLLAPVLLGSALFTSSARAVDVVLDGTSSLTGTACKKDAVYRFGTNSSFGGKQLDLLVKVLQEDNDDATCIHLISNTLSVFLKDQDANDDEAYIDLRITVVEKDTSNPVEVDRLAVTGFDLDTFTGAGTDDLYFKSPDGVYRDKNSNVTYSSGAFGDGFAIKLKGQTSGNCADGLTSTDVKCRAGVIFVNGVNGVNKVSTFDVRLKNDNAYGTDPDLGSVRLLQLSFEISYLTRLIAGNSDHGDAPNSYGDASHITSPNVTLGNGLPADDELAGQADAAQNAIGDDTDTGAGKYDDEDGVKRDGLALNGQNFLGGSTDNILDINTFGAGYLSAWIDLNRDGDFNDLGEKVISNRQITNAGLATTSIPISIPSTATGGKSYMRFRYTTATGIEPSVASTDPGEVEDYQVSVSSPNVLLVKRITAVNGNTTNGTVSLNAYDPDPTYPYDKNVIQAGVTPATTDKWPNTTGSPLSSTFLIGARDGGTTKPNDEVEYTIYFLSAGTSIAKNVTICDRIPPYQTFVLGAFNTLTVAPNTTPASPPGDRGIAVFQGSTTSPDTIYGYTNIGDGDAARYYPPGSTFPSACTQPALAQDNGAIVVNLGNLPNATNPGTPKESYGFLRFRTRLK